MISAKKELPEIYIYMVQSIDGKGSGEMLFAPESKFGMKYYFENQYSWGCKSILLGRTTCQIFLRDKEIDYTGITTDNIDKKDYISENKKKTEYYYITFDKNGKLPWPQGYGNFGRKQEIHIISVLSEDVDIKYLAYLQKIGASYIFAGEKNINLKMALSKLKNLFGIEKILCEGGPKTNEFLLKENLVNKLIIIKYPVIGQPGALSIFGKAKLSSWSLESFKMLSDGQTLLFVYNSKESS